MRKTVACMTKSRTVCTHRKGKRENEETFIFFGKHNKSQASKQTKRTGDVHAFKINMYINILNE